MLRLVASRIYHGRGERTPAARCLGVLSFPPSMLPSLPTSLSPPLPLPPSLSLSTPTRAAGQPSLRALQLCSNQLADKLTLSLSHSLFSPSHFRSQFPDKRRDSLTPFLSLLSLSLSFPPLPPPFSVQRPSPSPSSIASLLIPPAGRAAGCVWLRRRGREGLAHTRTRTNA